MTYLEALRIVIELADWAATRKYSTTETYAEYNRAIKLVSEMVVRFGGNHN